jgi:hypothetical protein
MKCGTPIYAYTGCRALRGSELMLFRIGIILAALLLLTACGGSSAVEGPPPDGEQETVTGTILNYESASLSVIRSLELQDAAGAVWVFEGGGAAVPHFSPSHLRDHMLLGLPVEITFVREGEALLIRNVVDATEG